MSGHGWQYVDIGTAAGPNDGYKLFDAGILTATVSATFNGAPVQLEFYDSGLGKRGVRLAFAPSPNDNSMSYTFAEKDRAETCGHTFRLRWRSPTHRRVRLSSGDVVFTYRPDGIDHSTPCT